MIINIHGYRGISVATSVQFTAASGLVIRKYRSRLR